MKRTLSILGSSGSIGRQTLKVAEACGHRVAAITVNRSVELAEAQVRKFRPGLVVAVDEAAAAELQVRLADTDAKVLSGQEGLLEAASLPEADTVVTAIVGVAGLRPTLAAINCGKRIALANKETLVCAGELVMARAEEKGAEFVTLFYGEDVTEEQAARAEEIFTSHCPKAEMSVLPGGQPVYYYIISIE